MVVGRVARGMLLPSPTLITDLSRYTFVRRHVGGGGIKTVLLQVSDNPTEPALICFLFSFSLVGLKAVRGWWWEQDRTAIVKGE